jgi:hypothetical protein
MDTVLQYNKWSKRNTSKCYVEDRSLVEPADEGVMSVYVEAGSRVELNCSIQGTANISWSRPQGSISRNSERKGVSAFPFILGEFYTSLKGTAS